MTQPLYLRKWKLSIETWRGDVLEVTDPLRVTFRLEKNINQIYQFGEITIYNLSPDTETDIFQNGRYVSLEAGYENGSYGVIFKGPIRQPVRGKEDAVTYFLRLVCLDGDDALNLGFVNLVISQGATAQYIAQQVARSSSVPFDIEVDELSPQKTKRGRVLFGQPTDILRGIAQNNNAKFYFDDGVAKIKDLSKAPPATVPEMNYRSGMIGIPHQVDKGIQVRCLINPSLGLDKWFKINNRDIVQAQAPLGELQTLFDRDGIYRIVELVITGDSRGNDWYYDIIAYGQNGPLAQMFNDTGQTGV